MQILDTMEEIISRVENLTYDFDEVKDQELDIEAVKRFRERFLLFVEDGCPAAINAYMQKANNDESLNDITKIHIMLDATHALEGKIV